MKKNSIYIYFLSHFLFLGFGFAKMTNLSSNDTYIAAFLGTLLGIGILYIICALSKKITCPFNQYFKENNFFNIIFKTVFLIFVIFNIFLLFIILSNFLYSYLLPFTPSFASCLPFVLLAAYLAFKKDDNTRYVAFILFILGLSIIVIKTLLLTNEFNINNLFPVLINQHSKIFKSALIYSFLSTTPILIIIDKNLSFKKSLKYYLIASLTNITVILTITLILGEISNMYSYPEYAILRKIRFFKFIENIENFICINWFFDLFISLTLLISKVKDLTCPAKKYYSLILVLFILFIVHKYFSNNLYNTIIIYKIFPYIYLAFLILIPFLLTIKIIKSKT